MADNIDRQGFIEKVAPLVQKHAKEFGFMVASPIIGQMCKESKFGTSELAKNCDNYMGIKLKNGRTPIAIGGYDKASGEFISGNLVQLTSTFAVFKNMEDCVIGYFQFLTSRKEYDNLKGVTDPKQYCQLLQDDNYAGDNPNYANSLYNDYVVGYGLKKYDDYFKEKESNSMSKINLIFDEGHDNKRNQSPVFPAYYESVAMWKLGHYCADILNATGVFQVDHTRPTNESTKDVVDRGTMMKGYRFGISFHSNACGTESVDRPVGIYLATDDTTNIDEESKDMAQLLTNVVKATMGTSQNPQIYEKLAGYDRNGNGNLKDDDYYGILYGAHKVGTPAIILEHSFHTNTKSAKWLSNDANLKALAQAEANAIIKYFNVSASTKPIENKPVEVTTATKYIVKSGDTLSKIAKQVGSTVEEILSLNPQITDPNKIYPKQEIIVAVNGADFFSNLKIGDPVRLKDNSTYYNGKSIPKWVFGTKLYYRGTNKNGVIVSILKIGAITGTVKKESIIPY